MMIYTHFTTAIVLYGCLFVCFNMDVAPVSPAGVLQRDAALLLSHIRDTCKTTQKTVDNLVAGVDHLLNLFLDVLKEKLVEKLTRRNGYLQLEEINNVVDIFRGQSFFCGVESKAHMETYIQEKSGGVGVTLEKVILESKTVIKAGRPRLKPTKFGYRVPFLPQLEQLLNVQDVLECIDNPAPYEDGVYKSVTDGLYCRYHPVVQEHGRSTLVFKFHVDDVDPCDALKSKAGHQNLRIFYWVLANIPPKKRSKLKAINLMAIVKTKVAKEKGNKYFMEDFIQGLIKLTTEGVVLNIRGKPRRFYAILLFGAADNPASANIGGFKETHSALRPCRMCMVKSGDMCNHYRESEDLMRQLLQHNKYVEQIEFQNALTQPSAVEVVTVDLEGEDCVEEPLFETPYQDHPNPSINFGINAKSILADIPGFDVTKCLPQDVLHLLAEGVVELVCRLVLRDLCVAPKIPGKRPKPLMKLEKVNELIQTYANLGHMSTSKPTFILIHHVTGSKLKQSAAQMFVLLKLLPFIIYEVLPQEKLKLVVVLNQLVDLCMSYEFTESDVELVGDLVEKFGTIFKKLYPKVKTLKLHCIVHLPTQITLFGPLRQQACFHFEAMHGKFTSLVSVINNMKNFAFSTASRVLIARSAEIMKDKDTGKYLYAGDIVKGDSNVCLGSLVEKDCLLEQFPHLSQTRNITKVMQIVEHSNIWQEGVVLLLEKSPQNIVFGRISAVYIIDGEYVFVFNQYETIHVEPLNRFQILRCSKEFHSVKYADLHHKFPIARISFNFKKGPLAYLLYSDLRSQVSDVQSHE